jgi:hypothetical protein
MSNIGAAELGWEAGAGGRVPKTHLTKRKEVEEYMCVVILKGRCGGWGVQLNGFILS